MIVLLATLLLAQAQPGHQRQGVPVPDTNRPAASEHGATLDAMSTVEQAAIEI